VNYSAVELGKDILSVIHVDGFNITSMDIEVVEKIGPGNNSSNSSAENNSSQVNGSKKAVNIVVSDKTFLATEKSKIVYILLTDNEYNLLSNKNLICTINGVSSVIKTNSKGQAGLKINLNVKTYRLTVKFAGDNAFKSSTKSAIIKIIKEKTRLTVPTKAYKQSSKSKAVAITLKSAGGKAIAMKKVTFKLNGKTYTGKTNSKGQAIVKVKLTVKKTYKFRVKFAGDSQFSAASRISSIKII
jgi:hypothetical protein